MPADMLHHAHRIIIAALTRERVIGDQGTIPWHIPEDLKNFRKLTVGHTVIMGPKTYASLGRPLPERCNLVVSRSLAPRPGIEVCRSFMEAMRKAESLGRRIFFIGGAEIYRQALPHADAMVLSWVRNDFSGDTRFPVFDGRRWKVVHAENHTEFRLVVYSRRPPATGAPFD